ncbi:MAG: tetratricopeptide repeat protein, partial [Bdellovibrionales bacterium]|nr:tetratricopeptide repeat protein [Bdellovibrionales bacterium]
LREQANSYYAWFQQRCPDQSLLVLAQARLLTVSGQPEGALRVLKPLMLSNKASAAVWLERGRALLRQGRGQEAVAAFDQALARQGNVADAMLGKGIALRSMHYESGDVEGLAAALECLEAVSQRQGYLAPEALHHQGTIHLALEDWKSAEECFRASLAGSPSPVSRRNLALVLHAQGRRDEGARQYRFLQQFYPADAAGLERYFPANKPKQTFVVHCSPLSTAEELDAFAESANDRLKEQGIVFENDVLDWRRFDDFINYYAPAGEFTTSSKLSGLPEGKVRSVLLDCALHLGAAAVRSGGATWVPGEEGDPEGAEIELTAEHVKGMRLGLQSAIVQRVRGGACSDNLTNLDMWASMLPGYRELSAAYHSPYVTFEAEEHRKGSFIARAQWAKKCMASFGFPLDGQLSDLAQMDAAIATIFVEGSPIATAIAEGRLDDRFIEDLGLYFGCMVEHYTGGIWHDHPDIYGVSLKGMLISDIFPVWGIRRRFSAGADAGELASLQSYESPLVCCQLARKLKDHEIETREQLQGMLDAALPSLLRDDPTGASLGRMTDMITALSRGDTY